MTLTDVSLGDGRRWSGTSCVGRRPVPSGRGRGERKSNPTGVEMVVGGGGKGCQRKEVELWPIDDSRAVPRESTQTRIIASPPSIALS